MWNSTNISNFNKFSSTIEFYFDFSTSTKQIEGIQGAQNLQFQLVYKGKNFKDLQAHSGDRKQHDFKVTYPDGLTCTFKGSYVVYVNQLSTNAAVQFNMNVTVSDGPNFNTTGVTATPGGDGGH